MSLKATIVISIATCLPVVPSRSHVCNAVGDTPEHHSPIRHPRLKCFPLRQEQDIDNAKIAGREHVQRHELKRGWAPRSCRVATRWRIASRSANASANGTL
ncbi:hypothetical protein GQ600_20899 [Phytophthora cactorum]|nr:hypothetical protein GQ600_20899 [Phytophthora cactorum]